jgi:hypothetical protein
VDVTNGELLSNHDCQILYILSGEISMFYVSHEEKTPNPANLLKVLLPGHLYCLFDLESDLFESGRSMKMILQCTSSSSSDSEPTKYLCISNDRLMDYLSGPHLQALKSIFQTRFVSACSPPSDSHSPLSLCLSLSLISLSLSSLSVSLSLCPSDLCQSFSIVHCLLT